MKPPNTQPILWRGYKNRGPLSIYLSFYNGYVWKLLTMVFAILLQNSPVYVIPILTADVINIVTGDGPHDPSSIWIRLVIGLFFIIQNVPSCAWKERLLSSVDREVEFRLRTSLCARLQHLSMHFLHEHQVGMLQSKVLRDVENIELLTKTLAYSLPSIAFNIIIALTITAMRAPQFLLLFLILIPMARFFYWLMHKRLDERNQRFRVSMESMTGYVNEMLRMLPVTRASNSEDLELEKAERHLNAIRKAGFRLDVMNAVYGAVNWALIMCFNILTLCIAGYLKMTGVMNIEAGDIVLLTGYFNSLSATILSLMSLVPQISKGLESVKSIGAILECKDLEQNENKPAVGDIKGGFKFDHLFFRYEDAEEDALEEINLEVQPGETVALVGPSGAGKSTLMQLLVGFNRPTKGRILLDGVDMNEIDLRTYRRRVSMITQETVLFGGRVRDNIAYGVPDVKPEDVDEAIRATGLDKALLVLPNGANTVLQENDARLSAGMRQRIAIARAFLRKPRVLLLDEPTSSLDEDAEEEVNQLLDKLIAGRTAFVVAHRLSTIQNADHIVIIDHGRVVEVGRHEELMAKGGRYAEMWQKALEKAKHP